MKIETSIMPRKDGTVIVTIDSDKYVFENDGMNSLVADVKKDEHIAFLLSRGDVFMPVDDADFEKADALVQASMDKGIEDTDEDEGLEDDEPENMDAAPIEEPASVVSADAPARAAKKTSGKK